MTTLDDGFAPHSRDVPPWTDCGDRADPDHGAVYARRVAKGALALSFDRSGRRHAITLFSGAWPGAEIVLHGRRFDVVAGEFDEDRR